MAARRAVSGGPMRYAASPDDALSLSSGAAQDGRRAQVNAAFGQHAGSERTNSRKAGDTMTLSPSWRGHRGEWYVVAQMCLFALVAVGPRTWHGWPNRPFPSDVLVAVIGWVLLASGGVLIVCGVAKLGSRICAVPYPPAGAVLQKTGVFCLVRHPMSCGGILAAFGWALLSQGWLTFVYALLLFVVFDLKSRREEAWLVESFAEHPDYQKRVRKLIPFVY